MLKFMAVLTEALQITDVVGSTLGSRADMIDLHPGKSNALPTRCASSAIQLEHGPPFFRLDPFIGAAIRSRHLYLSAVRHLRRHVNQKNPALLIHACE